MAKAENTFKSLIFRPCASLSYAFLLATVLRGFLIMQSQKLPSDSSELLPPPVRRMFFQLPTLVRLSPFAFLILCSSIIFSITTNLQPIPLPPTPEPAALWFWNIWKPESVISNKIKYTPNTGYELCLHYKWTSSMFTTCKCILFHQNFHFHL